MVPILWIFLNRKLIMFLVCFRIQDSKQSPELIFRTIDLQFPLSLVTMKLLIKVKMFAAAEYLVNTFTYGKTIE